MNQLLALLCFTATAVGLVACGGDEEPASQTSQPTVSETGSNAATATEPADTASESTCTDGALPVSALSNIFGAGGSELALPAPGGDGGGEPPARWRLPSSAKTVSFPVIEGQVTPIATGTNERPFNGPEGDKEGPTNIESYGGISGIVHRKNGMFLVGVFLTRKAPADPAPARLDFSEGEEFKRLSPVIAQTFFIGDGKGRTYNIPAGATRLFLGFADGALYQGLPGYYGNNQGSLCVLVEAA